jgi:riboflavin kinase/FMN adenylyltransferase
MPAITQQQKTTQPMRFYSNKTSGKHRGEEMGTPTINLEIPDHFPCPAGIYAGIVVTGTAPIDIHVAAFHYGPIPTFKESEMSLEAYVLEGKIDLPEKLIGFELIKYLRPIQNFKTKEALAKQILEDAKNAAEVFKQN